MDSCNYGSRSSALFQIGKEVPHPGISNDFGDEDAQKYYTYYQWVCFALFFQVRRSRGDA